MPPKEEDTSIRLTMLRHDSMLNPLVRRSLSANRNPNNSYGNPKREPRFLFWAPNEPFWGVFSPKCALPPLTFGDDAVEDRLQLRDADLHVL